MLNKQLFILAHEVGCSSFYSDYQQCVKNQWKPYKELKEEQEKQLRHIILYSYENVPYYHNLFKSLKLQPSDIRGIEDLEKLPLLTKDTIRQHWEDFKPRNLSGLKYYEMATGGSTGTPFSYRLSKHNRFVFGALLYRGWGYGGYDLGDKMVFLAGSSLDVGTKSRLATCIHETARNLRKLSSFDMGEVEMREYVRTINSFKPKFIRGYASSIYFFAKWIEENDLSIYHPVAVFTTAEKLFTNMRMKISDVFGCEVYDGYGMTDGGISAYECPEHSGLHIDTELGITEVVGPDGVHIEQGDGKILATNLHNYALPFIRYDTGDDATVIEDFCECGRGHKLLKEVIGRTVDILVTPEGKSVHGWFFLYIFWENCKGIKEYQVVQKTRNEIIIKLVIDNNFNDAQLERIKQIISSKSKSWIVKFQFVNEIERTRAGKYKFIINEVKNA